MTILVFSEIAYHSLHQRPQHIALALAAKWKVIWLEPATLGKKANFSPVEIEPNIFVLSLPYVPYNARDKAIRKIANLLSHISPLRSLLSVMQGNLIKKALRAIGSGGDEIGILLYNFHSMQVIKKIKSSFILFDYIDNAFGFAALPEHIVAEWKEAVSISNVITVTSPALAKLIEPYRTKNVFYVGNGVEYDHFAKNEPLSPPNDLPAGKPMVGYVGSVYPWLNYDLLVSVCKEMPDINFIFIGPQHPDIQPHIEAMKQLGNAFFLGPKKYSMLPQYLRYFSCGIIPFKRNELTLAVNPVKLYEYCAARVPTVATNFSDDLLEFQDYIFIAESAGKFVSSIRSAIEKKSNPEYLASLQSFARGHDWSEKTGAIIRHIESLHN